MRQKLAQRETRTTDLQQRSLGLKTMQNLSVDDCCSECVIAIISFFPSRFFFFLKKILVEQSSHLGPGEKN